MAVARVIIKQDHLTNRCWYGDFAKRYSYQGQFRPSFCVSKNNNYSRNNNAKTKQWMYDSFGAQLHHYLSYHCEKGSVHALLSLLSTKEQTLCNNLG